MAQTTRRPRTRAAQDATLINIRAIKRRLKEVSTLLRFVLQRQDRLDHEIDQLRPRKR